MLTPLDIQNKNFKHSIRGYNEEQVDDFLDEIANEMERLNREKEQLKADMARLKKDNEQYHALEDNLKQTLIIAQRSAEEVMAASRKNSEELRENTRRECENMKREAEMDAKTKIDEELQRLRTLVREYERIDHERREFLNKYKLALQSELSFINTTIEGLPSSRKGPAQQMPVMTQTREDGEKQVAEDMQSYSVRQAQAWNTVVHEESEGSDTSRQEG